MRWVLVAGGTGFIGTNLCKHLLAKGKHVIALDNHITSSTQQKELFANHPFYEFVYHDITEPLPDTLLNGKHIETIYHLACPTGVPNVVTLAEEMILTCSLGTRNILELARLHHADVIFTSSSEVYGNPEFFPQTEEYTGNVSPIGVRSPYEEGKRFSETLIAMYRKKYRLDGKIVRVFNTYGPHMSFHDTRVIPTFLRQIKEGKPLTIQGTGKQARTFCYIDDLIQGILLVKEKGDTGQVYNIGSGNEISMHELAKLLLSLKNGHKGYIFTPHFIEDHTRRLPSLEKMRLLGWTEETPLKEGLLQTLQWYGL